MKKSKCIIFITLFVLLSINFVYAFKLNLNISADKNTVKKNEEITIEVKWDKEMQAADFSLNYDSDKLEYIKSDVDDMFIDHSENGIIKTSWVSLDDTNKTSIKYTFKIIKTGKMKFTTSINGGFATGEMQMPDDYGNAELIIGGTNIYIIILGIIIALIIVVFVVKMIFKKNK